MTKFRKVSILLTVMLIFISLVLSSCNMIKKNPEAVANSIVAVVGGEKITKAQFDETFEIFKVQYEQQYGEDVWKTDIEGRKHIDVMREKVLDMLIDTKVQKKEAEKQGITVTDEEVEKQIANVKEYFKTEQEFNEFLKTKKITIDYLRNSNRDELMINKLKEKLTADVVVTNEEIATYYTGHQSEFLSVKASHILIEDEQQAQKALQTVRNGEDFNMVAYELSEDPTAKENRGELGYFRKGEMLEEFEEVAFKLKVGEISELVKTEYGYHIIKLEDRKYEKLEDVADELKVSLLNSNKDKVYQNLLEKMRINANIEKNIKNL